MSPPEKKSSGLVPHENRRASPASKQSLIPADDLIDLERARIDNANRRIDVMREAIAANERRDKQVFEFRMKHLEHGAEASRASHKTSKTVIYASGLSLLAFAVFCIYNVFYGDAEQKESALAIIKYFFIAVAGYGVISGTAKLFRKLTKFRQEEGE